MASITNFEKVRGNYRGYTLSQKKRALEIASRDGVMPTARLLKIPPSTIFSWRAKFGTVEPTYQKNPGQPAHFPEQEKTLSSWILQQREQHLPVTRQAIREYAKKLVDDVNFTASNGWIDRFMKRNGFSVRSKTTIAQRIPADLQKRTAIFLRQVEECRNEHEFEMECIINMDETPVFFDMIPGKTVEKTGSKSVPIRGTGAHKRHATVVLAVTASGDTLPPLVIFKGQRFPKDISSVPDGIHVEMQVKGWMTTEIMERWVKNILRPYTKRRPSLLVMDSFSAHTTDAVERELWKTNTRSAIIPGGCTSTIQPLDVSINKPFKSKLQDLWSSYIHRMVNGPTSRLSVSRQTLLEFIIEAWNSIANNSELIRKSFQVTGITGAVGRAEREISRNDAVLQEALMSDDSNTFDGFTASDLPPEPAGYDSDPFGLSDSDLD